MAAGTKKRRPGKGGRPPTLNAELSKAICAAVSQGVPFATACAMAGIHVETGRLWLRVGEGRSRAIKKNRAEYLEFFAAVKKARADDQARRILRINAAAKGGAVLSRTTTTTTKRDGTTVTVTDERHAQPVWQADAWHCERTDPEHFGNLAHRLNDALKRLDILEKQQRGRRPRNGAEAAPG